MRDASASAASASGPRAGDAGTSASAAYQPSVPSLVVAVTGSAIAWTVHLLAGYLVVAAWCSAGWRGGALAIAVLTAVCAAGAAASGLLALRIYRRAQDGLRVDREPGHPEPWDARLGERGARAVFLAVV